MKLSIKVIAICALMLIALPNAFRAMEKQFEVPEIIKKLAEYQKANNEYLIISGSAMPLWATITNEGSKDPEETFLENPARRNSIPAYNKQRPFSVENLYKQSIYNDRILFTREEPLFIPLDQIRYPLIISIWDATKKDSASPIGKLEIKEDYVKSRKADKWAKLISDSWNTNTGASFKLQFVDADLEEEIERPGFNPKKLLLPRYLGFTLLTRRERP